MTHDKKSIEIEKIKKLRQNTAKAVFDLGIEPVLNKLTSEAKIRRRIDSLTTQIIRAIALHYPFPENDVMVLFHMSGKSYDMTIKTCEYAVQSGRPDLSYAYSYLKSLLSDTNNLAK